MKIVATNEQLYLVDIYDLGDIGEETPDQQRFNRDITVPSNLLFMEYAEYLQTLYSQAAGEREFQERRDSMKVVVSG